jgi:deoxycytidine triphosphate deaminase
MNGILPHQELISLIPSVIVDGDTSCVRTASYDMRIGGDYYLYDEACNNGKEIRVRGTGVISIPPNGLLLCTMLESLKLPADIVGHLSLKQTLLMKGIIIASQSQIDAGYEGKIFGLLYNLSQKDLCLKDGEFVLKLELVRLEKPTSDPYNNSTSKTATLSHYIETPILSSLVGIRQDATKALDKVERVNITQILGGAALAIAGLVAGLHYASDSKVDRIDLQVTQLDKKFAVSDASASARTQMDDLVRQSKLLSERLDKIDALLKAQPTEPGHLPGRTSNTGPPPHPTSGSSP